VAEERSEYLTRAQERRLRIRELRETGLSMRAIAAEVGCSVGTVHNALKDAPSA
jgi:DNA-directed RNA polymerase specialized sigma24 family protein